MFVVIQVLSCPCLDPLYFAVEHAGTWKITGKNRQHKQIETDVLEARKWQDASGEGERGEAEFAGGAR